MMPKSKAPGSKILSRSPPANKPSEEVDSPERVASDGFEHTGQDAADTCDLAVQQQHRRRAQADEHAAEQRGERGEVMHKSILRALPRGRLPSNGAWSMRRL